MGTKIAYPAAANRLTGLHKQHDRLVEVADECVHPLPGDTEPRGGFGASDALLTDGADDDEILRFTPHRGLAGQRHRCRDSAVNDHQPDPHHQASTMC